MHTSENLIDPFYFPLDNVCDVGEEGGVSGKHMLKWLQWLFPNMDSAAQTFFPAFVGTGSGWERTAWCKYNTRKAVGRYSKHNMSTTEGVLFIRPKSDDFGCISSHGQRACLHHISQLEPDLWRASYKCQVTPHVLGWDRRGFSFRQAVHWAGDSHAQNAKLSLSCFVYLHRQQPTW